MRNINRPVADASGITKIVPVELGGFGSTNADEAAANIAAASSSLLGLPNGLAQLDEDGKISLENFPSPTMFAPTLKGPTKVNPGERVIYEITNWEPGKSYIVSATAGSVSIAGNQVAFIAPKDFGIVGLSVGDRTVNVEVTSITRITPELFIVPDISSFKFTTSHPVGNNGSSVRKIQLELKTSEEIKLFLYSVNDTSSFEVINLEPNRKHSARVRLIDENEIVSEWSRDVIFHTLSSPETRLKQIIKDPGGRFRKTGSDEFAIFNSSHLPTVRLFKVLDGYYSLTKEMIVSENLNTVAVYSAASSSHGLFFTAAIINSTSVIVTMIRTNDGKKTSLIVNHDAITTGYTTGIYCEVNSETSTFRFNRSGAWTSCTGFLKYDPVQMTLTNHQIIGRQSTEDPYSSYSSWGCMLSNDGLVYINLNGLERGKCSVHVNRRLNGDEQFQYYGELILDSSLSISPELCVVSRNGSRLITYNLINGYSSIREYVLQYDDVLKKVTAYQIKSIDISERISGVESYEEGFIDLTSGSIKIRYGLTTEFELPEVPVPQLFGTYSHYVDMTDSEKIAGNYDATEIRIYK